MHGARRARDGDAAAVAHVLAAAFLDDPRRSSRARSRALGGDPADAAATRVLAMTGELERQHELLAPWPHLRLDFFGVLPDAQGTGIGSRLIEHGHRAADAAGLPCYLETFTERNVAYYGRRGWDVTATYTVGDNVPVYALVRQPSG